LATTTAVETRFGSFETNPKWVVTMTDGIPGFETCRRFIVIKSESMEPFTCLNGLEGETPSFLAIDPRLAQPDYPLALSADDRRRLGATADEPLLWLALVTVRADAVLVNLRAPVVINPRSMVGLQVIDAESTLPTEHRLALD
jgi:flagellar assembly factor FliW